MKKQILLFILTLLPMLASADVVEIDGVYYNLLDNQVAEVYRNSSIVYSGEVVIKESFTYKGIKYRVTRICAYAFNHSTGLTSITIPNSVTYIGLRAFYSCTSLKAVYISDLVAWFNISFQGGYSNPLCNNCHLYLNGEEIKDLVIPNSVTSIGGAVFYGCSNLTSVTIPNSVTSIGTAAFHGCSSLTSVTIPNSVTSIGGGAFNGCTNLTSITIPNSVTSIGEGAFQGCSSLTSVTIPNSVTSIGMVVFSECSSLNYINVERGNTVYDSRENCNAIIETSTNELIAGCKNTIIPNSVTSIGDYAFYSCSSLTSITIPNSVTSIGGGAFENCRSLTSITIPSSVTSIGGCAFAGCSNLTSVTIPNSVTTIGHDAFDGCSGLTSITIPNSVTSIGGWAFNMCTGLTSITIPNSVISIGQSTFIGCTNLTSIVVEDGNPNYDSRNNCNALIETSSNTLLSGCMNTTIPNSVTDIGNYAFYGCNSLTFITIPNSVTSIGHGAFEGCSNLTSVTIPNSVIGIGRSAFYNCTSLTSITIGSRVQSIDLLAFESCPKLTDFYCYAVNIPHTLTNFDGSNFEYATLHVPDESLQAYKDKEPWSKFGTIVALTDEDPKPTGIENVNYNGNVNNRWYSLDGQLLQGMPTQKGVYIHNGKKIVLK